MVFSFFKKPLEKMPERPAARPRAPAGAGPSSPPAPVSVPPEADSRRPEGRAVSAPAPARPAAPASSLDFTKSDDAFTDSQFSASSIMAIEVEHDVDPVQADVEQAAVLFANGQESAARSVLEMAARSQAGPAGERLWRMLLDLVQLQGDRVLFERLALEFAEACETSPPAWRAPETGFSPAPAGETVIALAGVVTGADAQDIARLRTALVSRRPVRVDFGKLAGCDDAAANALCELLRQARRQAVPLALAGEETLVARLAGRLKAGQKVAPGAWLLLLELYQRLGRQEPFEERAIDYAVTFEMSPPSWEEDVPRPENPAAPPQPAVADEAFFLEGELKNHRFDGLSAYLDAAEQPVLDFSRVRRIDFFSAGLLRNLLEPVRLRGREVVIRHPNRLVAELMQLVSLGEVARIILPKS